MVAISERRSLIALFGKYSDRQSVCACWLFGFQILCLQGSLERESRKKDVQADWEGEEIRGGFGSSGDFDCDLLSGNEATSWTPLDRKGLATATLKTRRGEVRGSRGDEEGRGLLKQQQQQQGKAAARES